MEKLSFPALAEKVPDEEAAIRLLEEWRWGDRPVCPLCGSVRTPYFLTPKADQGRKTRRGRASVRRVWKCADCRRQFSVTTNTIMHGSHIPVRTWLFVMFEMASSKNGVAAREIQRKYELTPKSAWFMTQRVREAMRRDPLAGMLRGTVVADETFIGGKPSNRHAVKRPQERALGVWSDKTAVVSLVDKGTGEVRSQVVPKVNGENLRQVIKEHVDMPATVLHTDENSSYRAIGLEMAGHESVNHSYGEYVRDGVSTNHAEGYFSQLKRSIDGTHHHVSVEHLGRYLAEFDYRYSTCKLSDTARMHKLLGQVPGRRLSYKPLTAE
jgi:transposase-like protein